MAALLFDLDGTLTNPIDGIAASIRYALDKVGVSYSKGEGFAWCVGPPLDQSLLTLCGGDKVLGAQALEYYRDYYRKEGMLRAGLYDGIAATLQTCSSSGHRLFVATSKPTPFAVPILKHFGLFSFFDAVQGAEMDGSISEKADVIRTLLNQHNLDPSKCIMIGDRKHDVIGAKQHGLIAIGVSWGFGGDDELKAHGVDHICSAPAALPVLIRSITG